MDKSMLGDLGSLPPEDQARMSTMIDQLQIRDRFSFLSLLLVFLYDIVFTISFVCIMYVIPPISKIERFVWDLKLLHIFIFVFFGSFIRTQTISCFDLKSQVSISLF